MSAIKFQVGQSKKLTLSFDSPKTGKNDYGNWYMYGFKSDINSDEDCFFATETLHVMIQTLGAKEGDEITIEKCQDGDIVFFKVNGLTINDMNSGGSFDRIQNAKPTGANELAVLREENMRLKAEIEALKSKTETITESIDPNDIPF